MRIIYLHPNDDGGGGGGKMFSTTESSRVGATVNYELIDLFLELRFN
jgi:hypothetical protein